MNKLVQFLKGNFFALFFSICLVSITAAVIYRFVSPNGFNIEYRFGIGENPDLYGKLKGIGDITTVQLDPSGIKTDGIFEVYKDKVEFAVQPIRSDVKNMEFSFDLAQSDNNLVLFELTNFDKNESTTKYILSMPLLQQLPANDYSYNGYKVWAFNPNLKTLSDLATYASNNSIDNPTITSCSIESSFRIDPTNINTTTTDTVYKSPHILRGPHNFDIYVGDDGKLNFNFNKRDLNWYSGSDDMTIKLSYYDNLVLTAELEDDGVYDGIFGRLATGKTQNYSLNLNGLPKGVYQLTTSSSDDLLISDISTTNERFVVTGEVFLANNIIYGVATEKVDLFTNSPRIFVKTYHDLVDQAVYINDDFSKNPLIGLQTYETLLLANQRLNKVSFSVNDLKLSSEGYFALGQQNFFVPNKVEEHNCTNYPIDILKQYDLLAIKNMAQQSEDGTFKLTIPFDKKYLGAGGKVYFYLNTPGMENSSGKLIVKNLSVKFTS